MVNMKLDFRNTLAVLIALFLLSACGGGSAKTEQATEEKKEESGPDLSKNFITVRMLFEKVSGRRWRSSSSLLSL